ncbi:MAG TPA: hypothetical protein VFG37_03690 [Planctomycetota bacterium]|nr:hypothetical protein [Planctomycetota bacterium]
MDLVITVDTEEDDEWSPRPSTTCENLRFVPRFQELCESRGFPVTWLLTHGAATSPLAPQTFRAPLDRGACEVGAHLHPWNTPPNAPRPEPDGAFFRPYPLEYPRDVQREMLAQLTGAIEESLGVRPRSYRAGRYGFDATGAALLRELGYEVDCSVTPGVSWRGALGKRGGAGGPDFVGAPQHPYWPAADDVTRAGPASGLLEVPVTLVHTRAPLRGDHRLTRAWSRFSHDGFVARVARKTGFARTWLRPYPKYSLADLEAVCDSARAAGAPLLEMILHSSELMPGCSPYRKDEAAVDALHRDVGALLTKLSARGVRGATLLDFSRRFAAA